MKTKQIIDISLPVSEGMPKHPAAYLSGVTIKQVANHKIHKRSIQSLTISTHVSTHIDAPFHTLPDGLTVENIPLSKLCGPVKIINILEKNYNNPITDEDIKKFELELKEYKKFVIRTEWADNQWNTDKYFLQGPFFTRNAAKYLAEFDLDLLAIDFPNVDSPEDTVAGKQNPNHAILLKKNIILLENIINIQNLPSDSGKIYCLPIKLKGADGCPCRAILEL